MDKREAKRWAYRLAHSLVDGTLRDGGAFAESYGYYDLSPDDQLRIDQAMDDIAQMLWERGNPAQSDNG